MATGSGVEKTEAKNRVQKKNLREILNGLLELALAVIAGRNSAIQKFSQRQRLTYDLLKKKEKTFEKKKSSPLRSLLAEYSAVQKFSHVSALPTT